MPFDSNGNYSLPSGYEAENGQTIQPSQHNTPLEDIRSALSSVLLRSGTAPMTGALKVTNGTVAAPGLSFNTATGTGFYKTTAGFAAAVNGTKVAEFGASALLGAVPVGAGMDYWGSTAPPYWLFPYGQAVSRVTYADLFAAYGTTYGSGDGSTTFNLPDKRNRLSYPKGDMGGSDAGRVTTTNFGSSPIVLGNVGGDDSYTLARTALPNVKLDIYTEAASSKTLAVPGILSGTNVGAGSAINIFQTSAYSEQETESLNGNVAQTEYKTLPPGIVCNYIIFAGA